VEVVVPDKEHREETEGLAVDLTQEQRFLVLEMFRQQHQHKALMELLAQETPVAVAVVQGGTREPEEYKLLDRENLHQ
jgi:hypothetical protein